MNPDNRPVWDGQKKGWQESWFLVLHDAPSRTAFWIRYTLVSPADSDPFAALWLIAYPHDSPPVATRQVFPAGEFSASPVDFHVAIGPASLSEGKASGRVDELTPAAWNLTFRSAAVTYHPAPALLRPFFPTLAFPNPRTRFHGTLRFGRRSWELSGAPGFQGHFGSEAYGSGWTWAHATEFDEGAGFADAVAPGRGLVASVGVAFGGRAWAGNTLSALTGGACEGEGWKRTFRAETEEGPVGWEVTGDPARAIGLELSDPRGKKLYVYNTLLASSVIHAGGSRLHSKGTTVFEIASELPRLDVPIALRAPVPAARAGFR